MSTVNLPKGFLAPRDWDTCPADTGRYSLRLDPRHKGKKSQTYHVQFRIDGRPFTRSTGKTVEREAEIAAKELIRQTWRDWKASYLAARGENAARKENVEGAEKERSLLRGESWVSPGVSNDSLHMEFPRVGDFPSSKGSLLVEPLFQAPGLPENGVLKNFPGLPTGFTGLQGSTFTASKAPVRHLIRPLAEEWFEIYWSLADNKASTKEPAYYDHVRWMGCLDVVRFEKGSNENKYSNKRKVVDGSVLYLDQVTVKLIDSKLVAFKQFAPNAARGAISKMKNFFTWCVKNDYLTHNPCVGLERFKHAGKGKKKRVLVSEERYWELLGAVSMGYSLDTAWWVRALFHTGMPPSDLFTLEPEHLVEKQGVLYIVKKRCKSKQGGSGEEIINQPLVSLKTDSKRLRDDMEELVAYLLERKEECLAIGQMYLFNPEKKEPKAMMRELGLRFERACTFLRKAAKLKTAMAHEPRLQEMMDSGETTLMTYIKSVPELWAESKLIDKRIQPVKTYDCRHSFTTRCVKAGVQESTLQRWLGHKPGSRILQEYYNHNLETAEEKSGRKLEDWQRGEDEDEVIEEGGIEDRDFEDGEEEELEDDED